MGRVEPERADGRRGGSRAYGQGGRAGGCGAEPEENGGGRNPWRASGHKLSHRTEAECYAGREARTQMRAGLTG